MNSYERRAVSINITCIWPQHVNLIRIHPNKESEGFSGIAIKQLNVLTKKTRVWIWKCLALINWKINSRSDPRIGGCCSPVFKMSMVRFVLMVATAAFTSLGTTSPDGQLDAQRATRSGTPKNQVTIHTQHVSLPLDMRWHMIISMIQIWYIISLIYDSKADVVI